MAQQHGIKKGCHWEPLKERIGIWGTLWEPDGNTLGTNPTRNPSLPPPPKENNLAPPSSFLIGSMKFLFPKLPFSTL